MSPSAIIGIDPGASGGIAIVGPGIAEAHKMPKTDRDLLDLLAELAPRASIAILERLQPMPMRGCIAAWKLGQSYGSLRMALAAARVPYELVTPGKWQRALGCLSRGDKNVTKAKAQALFPDLRIIHATADALLLAEYGRRTLLRSSA